jgi:hypothetical protein
MSRRKIRRALDREIERELKRERGVSRRSTLAAGATVALGAGMFVAPATEAATFEVTSTEDDGTGTTLREAVNQANSAAGDDVIVFQSGLSGAIELEVEPIFINGQGGVDIQGPGASAITIEAYSGYKIFDIGGFDDPHTPVRIAGLTLTGGNAAGGGAILSTDPDPDQAADLTIADAVLTGNRAGSGGAVLHRHGSLTISGSVLSDNEAVRGGGLYSVGADAVTIANSAITGNQASGVHSFAGGLLVVAPGDVAVTGSTISGNGADDPGGGYAAGGGGQLDAGGDLSLRNVTVAGNEAETYGGIETSSEGALLIEGSTFSDNTAEADAGGLVLGSSGGPAVVRNSTVSGNTATAADSVGGGIHSFNPLETPRTIENSTLVGNSAGYGGGIYTFYVDGDDFVGLTSTIVAGNTATAAGPDIYEQTEPPPCCRSARAPRGGSNGGFELAFSLVGSTSGAAATESPAGSNIFGVDPQLAALANNGGPTQTHLPAVTSPALDKGIANGLATDQRGLARTGDLGAFANAAGGDGTDIGAVEIQAADCQGQGAVKLDGTESDDTLTGTSGSDSINTLGGADTANGAGGKDCVNGDAGKDKLKGGGGMDKVKGGSGKDRASGGGGKDKLSGQGGKDKLSGGGGKDRLKGGPGKDKIKTGAGKDKVNCGGGKDKVSAQAKDKVSRNCERVVARG